MNNITTLLNQIGEIIKKHEEIARLSGENFNVFKLIGVTTDEVRLHSRFLAELLNPYGSHGQGDLFLKLFISELEIDSFDIKTAKVDVEKNIGEINDDKTEGGQIDILIKDKNDKTIIIENKIYAGDQENQLLRYYNYSKENTVALFYLTLDGKDPERQSYGKLVKNKDFYCISYKTDILNWLIECRKEAVQQALLREGISHYINVIKFLTGQSTNQIMDKAMSDEIVEKILKNKENLESSFKIAENINKVKTEIQWQFWEKLFNDFKDDGYIFEVFKDEGEKSQKISRNVIQKYYSENKKYYGFAYLIEIKTQTIVFKIQLDDTIYFSFNRKKDENSVETKQFDKIIKSINRKYTKNQTNDGWRNIVPDINFKTNIQFLYDEDNMEQIVAKIVEEAIKDIENMKKKLEELEN